MGRKYVGKKRTYRVNVTTYKAFKKFCHAHKITVSKAIQQFMTNAILEGVITELDLETLLELQKEVKEKEK